MTHKEFVEATICKLNQSVFNDLKQLLLGEYISFSIIDHEAVTKDILAEKVCDYFVALEAKTGKEFDTYVESYLNHLDSIVKPHIAEAPQAKKGNSAPVVDPRSRKYYKKASDTKKNYERAIMAEKEKPPFKKQLTRLIDYSRIMMCLYTAVIKNEGKPIDNFDYAVDCLVPASIVEAMKSEESSNVFSRSRKKRFDTKETYSNDVCTLILSILILCSIINGKVEGETNHE